MEAYDKLIEKAKELSILWSIRNSILWDTRTGLPAGAIGMRAEQTSFLGKIENRIASDNEIEQLLKEIESGLRYDSLNLVQKRNMHLIRRDFDFYNKIPEDLNAQLERQITMTNQARERAKASQDWSIFEPELKKMVDLDIEVSAYIMDVIGVSNPLDAKIGLFEEGMRVEYITRLFDEITKYVVPLVKKFSNLSDCIRTDFLNRRIDRDSQKRLIERLAEIIGYDLKSEKAIGKLGESVHPVTIGTYDDVRIALYYDEYKFLDSFYAFIHECGHALYNINLNREWMFEPVGRRSGSAVHESQAQFLEKMVGRSFEFLRFILPKINEYTNGVFKDISLEDFVRAVNLVKPGKIRVNSDELTYNLHIIIRFEIEKKLFAREIDVSDIPGIWNSLYEKYLGVEIEHDGEGALQDVHWGAGMFGMFPCYTLGNIFAAQFVEKMAEEIPDWKSQICEGKFHNVVGWMSENVHMYSSLYDAPGLMKHVTGKEISAKPYLEYLEEKYSTLYD